MVTRLGLPPRLEHCTLELPNFLQAFWTHATAFLIQILGYYWVSTHILFLIHPIRSVFTTYRHVHSPYSLILNYYHTLLASHVRSCFLFMCSLWLGLWSYCMDSLYLLLLHVRPEQLLPNGLDFMNTSIDFSLQPPRVYSSSLSTYDSIVIYVL